MATSTANSPTGKGDGSAHHRAQLESPRSFAPDETWSEAAVLWIELYYGLLSAAVTAPSHPVVLASDRMVYQEFKEYFKVNNEMHHRVQDKAHKRSLDDFQTLRSALVPKELAEVTASLRYSTKRENPEVVDIIAIDPIILDRYKTLRGPSNLDEEKASPERRVALRTFVNGVLRQQHPDIYALTDESVEACHEDIDAASNAETRAAAHRDEGQPGHLTNTVGSIHTAPPQASVHLYTDSNIRELLVTVNNVRQMRNATRDAHVRWERRNPEQRAYIAPRHAAIDNSQPSQRGNHAFITPTQSARSLKQSSSIMPRTTRRRKAPSPTHDEPSPKRARTAAVEPATKKATATTKTRKPPKSRKTPGHDSVSAGNVREDGVGGRSASATSVPDTAAKKAKGKKFPWTVDERKTLYGSCSTFSKEKGMEIVDRGKDSELLRYCTDALNKAFADLYKERGSERTIEMVHSQLRHRIEDPNKKFTDHPVKLWYARAEDIKARITKGEVVPDNERYPEQAIPRDTVT